MSRNYVSIFRVTRYRSILNQGFFSGSLSSSLPLILSFLIGLLGCSSPPTVQVYRENLLGGIRIEYPSNWELTADERLNNRIVLETERGFLRPGGARVEILFGGEPSASTIDLEPLLNATIERFRSDYGPDAVEIVRKPEVLPVGAYEVILATVAIQTTSMESSSYRNQWEREEPDLQQIVDLYIVNNPDLGRFAAINVFKGSSSELNAEAKEIVNSIIAYVSDAQD